MKQAIIDTLRDIKTRIAKVETDGIKLSETDTRQGLINPVFSALGWDFSDFTQIKAELRHKEYNDPVDYAFFSVSKKVPILLLEAKTLGTDLSNSKIVKQLCMYLGEMGVQWGVLSDGNKYVMYNSRGGDSFEDQKFITLQIKTIDTEDGMPVDEMAEKFIALLGRECLESDDVQKTYEEHMVNNQIEEALHSLLSTPFDTLASAIRKEFKEDRVKTNDNLKISSKQIIAYLNNIADEDGNIPIDISSQDVQTDNEILHDVAKAAQESSKCIEIKQTSKRISIKDLLTNDIIHEGDNWKFMYKGEASWARITGNGELELDGKIYLNPSRAGSAIIHKPCSGWNSWYYKNNDGDWHEIEYLRKQYREKYGIHMEPRPRKVA